MGCCMKFGSPEMEKSLPVRKHFDIVFQAAGKTIGFNSTGVPQYITDPIIKQFKGMVYTYICTKDGSIYSTTKLQVFKWKGGDTQCLSTS